MSQPDTAGPGTAQPETAHQGTAGGETAGPGATAPEARAPETTASETGSAATVPETTASETRAPETGSAATAPETRTPETTASETRAPERGTEAASPEQTDDGRMSAKLIPDEQARQYQNRWNELKGQFVDDPQRALLGIDGLVGDVLSQLEDTFRRQRGELESGLHGDQVSTEELRQAFGRYREFFDRLLSF